MDDLCTFNIKIKSKILNECVSKSSDHIQIKIKITNSSQEPPPSYKTQNQEIKDMDVLCTLNINWESQTSGYGYMKDQGPYPSQDQDTKPIQEPPASSKAPNEDLKDMDVLCTFKIKLEI